MKLTLPWLRAKSGKVETPAAIANLSRSPTAENRGLLYQSLKTGFLHLAAESIPAEWGDGPVTLSNATQIPTLTSDAPGGGKALLAFTSRAAVVQRSPGSASFAMESLVVLELVLSEDYDALVIDPQGPWAAVPRADVAGILSSAKFAP